MDDDLRSRALVALGSFAISAMPLDVLLTEISALVVEAVPAAAFAGMTLLGADGRPSTAIFTSDESPEIDQAQYASGEGPCLDAWRTGSIVIVGDTRTDRAYPAFSRTAVDHGILATLSLPLCTDGASIGALNLYGRTAGGFASEPDHEVTKELTAVAAQLIENSQSYWGAMQLTDQLQVALESRAVIEQAKGILMAETKGLGPDGAFGLLRAASQRENLKLREIAERIVESRSAT